MPSGVSGTPSTIVTPTVSLALTEISSSGESVPVNSEAEETVTITASSSGLVSPTTIHLSPSLSSLGAQTVVVMLPSSTFSSADSPAEGLKSQTTVSGLQHSVVLQSLATGGRSGVAQALEVRRLQCHR